MATSIVRGLYGSFSGNCKFHSVNRCGFNLSEIMKVLISLMCPLAKNGKGFKYHSTTIRIFSLSIKINFKKSRKTLRTTYCNRIDLKSIFILFHPVVVIITGQKPHLLPTNAVKFTECLSENSQATIIYPSQL